MFGIMHGCTEDKDAYPPAPAPGRGQARRPAAQAKIAEAAQAISRLVKS
jgi:hypothetical protein